MGNNTQVQLLRSNAPAASWDRNTVIDVRLGFIKGIYLMLRDENLASYNARLLSKILMGHMASLATRQDKFTREQAQAGALLYCEILSNARVLSI